MSRKILAVLLLAAAAGPLCGQVTLAVTQPFGPGSLDIAVGGAPAASHLFILVSLFPANPTGSGPIFGLSAQSFTLVIEQITMPLHTHPFHVLADGSGGYHLFVWLPGGTLIPIDAVALAYNPAIGVTGMSPVVFTTFDI